MIQTLSSRIVADLDFNGSDTPGPALGQPFAVGATLCGGRVLMSSGAAPDPPVHPFLPESAYLKGQLLQLD